MAKYDEREALEILGAYAEKSEPHTSDPQKKTAATELLEAVAALKLPGLATRREDDSVWIGFSGDVVRVVLARGNHFLVVTETNKPHEVPLVFNRATLKFESKNLDQSSRIPVPGEPKEKRREALAEIADLVVKVLKGSF
jgi:hypothetical protein